MAQRPPWHVARCPIKKIEGKGKTIVLDQWCAVDVYGDRWKDISSSSAHFSAHVLHAPKPPVTLDRHGGVLRTQENGMGIWRGENEKPTTHSDSEDSDLDQDEESWEL
jgi:hypothetical protein